jgi:hypothetical protein
VCALGARSPEEGLARRGVFIAVLGGNFAGGGRSLRRQWRGPAPVGFVRCMGCSALMQVLECHW